MEFDEEAAKEVYNFTDEELNYYESSLESLTPEEVNNKLLTLGIDMENYDGNIIYKEDENGEVQEFAVIAWLAGIGFVSFVGYFSGIDILHIKKNELYGSMFRSGGNPIIDSRDRSGSKVQTNEAEAERIGGYNFACENQKETKN